MESNPFYYIDEDTDHYNKKFLLCLLASSIHVSYCHRNGSLHCYHNDSIDDDNCTLLFNSLNVKGHSWQYFSEGTCDREEIINGSVHLVCAKGLDEHYARRSHYRIHHLTLEQWPLVCFPPDHVLRHFPMIRNLTIKDSKILQKFSTDFPATLAQLRHLKLFNLTNLILTDFVFSHLGALSHLDLRNNGLKHIKPEILSSPPNLTSVFLLNNLWNCSHPYVKWLSIQNTPSASIARKRIVDYSNMTCQGEKFKGKPLPVVMDLLKLLHNECPKECDCQLENLVKTPGLDELVPVSKADCRMKNLTDFPSHVPSITTAILLQGNKISDIRPLAQNPAYKKVIDVYLNHNRISTLRPLEGSDWLMSFRILNVAGNNITQIPNYAFDNAFQCNLNIAAVFLGRNPWRCDCRFTPRFQEVLHKHRKIINDISKIKCVMSDNEELSLKPIYSLPRNAICRQTAKVMEPIDALNIILAILILIVFVKFGYDYFNYKKTGKLPWLVDKIPC